MIRLPPVICIIFIFCSFFLLADESESSLIQDIDTSRYFELQQWCRDLGLEVEGSADILRARIRDYFKINADDKTLPSDSRQIIYIENADESTSLTIEDSGTLVQLTGRVRLTMKEEDKEHKILADELWFNQKENLVYASGHIDYTLTENKGNQHFTGDTISFILDSGRGSILNGELPQTEGQDLSFIFMGSRIDRGGDRLIIIQNARISSRNLDDTYYTIRAGRIWVTGIDEWGLLNGFLFVGHIPMFYLPFYFNPGDDMFFNPSYCYKSREGYYMNNTVYLHGRKDNSQDESLSFLKAVKENSTTFKLEREGLFLVKKEGSETETENYSKIGFDFYSRLGLYLFSSGSFKKDKNIPFDIKFRIDAAVTRNIYQSGDYYYPFDKDDDYLVTWNENTFFGYDLPLRLGGFLNISLNNFQSKLMWYTDPEITDDFYDRSENFSWSEFAISQEYQGKASDDSSDSSTTSTLNNYVQWNKSFRPDFLYINSFNISKVYTSALFNTKTDSDVDSIDPDYKFYYLSSVTFPELSLSMAGQLYKSGAAVSSEKQKSKLENPEKDGYKFSWTESSEDIPQNENPDSEGEDNIQEKEPISPGLEKISLTAQTGKLFNGLVSYKTKLDFKHLGETDTSSYTKKDDVDLSLYSSQFDIQPYADISSNLDFLDDRLQLNATTSWNQLYRQSYFYEDLDDETEASEELNDQKVKTKNLKQVQNTSFYPFKYSGAWNKSYIKYNVTSYLYRNWWDSSEVSENTSLFKWNDESVTSHSVSSLLSWSSKYLEQQLTYKRTLAPLEELETVSVISKVTIDIFTLSFNQNYQKEEEDWEPDDLKGTMAIKFSKDIYVNSSITYDFEEEDFKSGSVSQKAGGLTNQLNYSYGYEYSWNSESISWEASDEKVFHPISASSSYTHKLNNKKYWKSRLEVTSSASSRMYFNLDRYNQSYWDFSWILDLSIYKFLDLKFTLNSRNNAMFLYFPSLAEDEFGLESRNFLTDFTNSLIFWNEDKRYESNFNMESLSIDLNYHMEDWKLNFKYSGSPELDSNENKYLWNNVYSINISWSPIPEINSIHSYDDNEWDIDRTEY